MPCGNSRDEPPFRCRPRSQSVAGGTGTLGDRQEIAMNIDELTISSTDLPTEADEIEVEWLDNEALSGRDTLTVGKVFYPAGGGHQDHYHPNCDEALYLLSGEISHTLGEEETILRAGDLLHIPEGVPHGAHNHSDDTATAMIVYDTGDVEAIDVE